MSDEDTKDTGKIERHRDAIVPVRDTMVALGFEGPDEYVKIERLMDPETLSAAEMAEQEGIVECPKCKHRFAAWIGGQEAPATPNQKSDKKG